MRRAIKRDIYMISSFLTALAGTFYTQYIYFIDPATAFNFNISIEAALVSIVGGIGTLWGPVIGTVLLETTSALLQSWLGSSIGGVQLTVYSLILMAVILWRPTGHHGVRHRSLARAARARAGEVKTAPWPTRWSSRISTSVSADCAPCRTSASPCRRTRRWR